MSGEPRWSEARLDELVRRLRLDQPILVTRPTMPSRQAFDGYLERIWETRQLTNRGEFHQELESSLASYLGVEHLSVFCNGTIALLVALQLLRIDGGEVITTPFSFPATPHVLHWNRIRPVFCDIDRTTFNLDPERVERLISAETKAILGVHVYGTPCDVEALRRIADRHGLYVIYDAAHSFGSELDGRSLASYGDVSMLSFHATKLFSTLEGGALVLGNEAQKRRTDFLRNFGIADEETVIGPGINGKMNELQSAFGLLHLQQVDREIARRGRLEERYRERLGELPGLRLRPTSPRVKSNHAYFPILVDAEAYGLDRDELYRLLKLFNVMTRKYFFPLCSTYPCYSELSSSEPEKLPVAHEVARQALCLPLYGGLKLTEVDRICDILTDLHRLA